MLIRNRVALAGAPVVALLAAIAAVAAQTPKAGFADAVLGRWDLTVQSAEGPYPSWLEVHLRKESQIQSRFVGRSGSVRYAIKTEYHDGQLTVVIPVQYEKNKTDLRFVGTLVADRLHGTTTGEKGETLQWTGVRAPAASPSRSVSWGTPIELFNGRDTSGWRLRDGAAPACWSAVDGTLTNSAKCSDIVSERSFQDFKLHIEFMYPAGSNSGVYLRGRYEVQIDDSASKTLDALRLGGVYGFLRPYVAAGRSAGEWQTYDVTLVGSRVTVTLNDKTIIDNELIAGITGGALDSNEAEPGPLMLQGDHGKISFRNITVTPAQ